MIIRTLIADDELLARQLVRKFLAAESEIDIVGECATATEALKFIKEKKPQLVLLDIKMPGLSGLDMLRQLEAHEMPYIIFITAYDRYAIRAFEVHALDYLLKPLEKVRFADALARARERIRRDGLSQIAEKLVSFVKSESEGQSEAGAVGALHIELREGDRLFSIPQSDVYWIEAANQYINIHTAEDCYLQSQSLSAIEAELDALIFFRVHRSAIVNRQHVKEVLKENAGNYSVVLRNGAKVPLSRSRHGLISELLSRR